MGRYPFVEIITVPPFEKEIDSLNTLFFQFHIHLILKAQLIYSLTHFICTFNNRIKIIQYNDGYYEGETKDNIKNG